MTAVRKSPDPWAHHWSLYEMALSSDQQTFARDVARLIEYAASIGIGLTFGHAYREPEEQARLVARGASKTQNSRHCDRLAVDFNFFIGGKLTYAKPDIAPLGEFWESLHEKNRWGGNFASFLDVPHFQRDL